jgi:TPR repeat protein
MRGDGIHKDCKEANRYLKRAADLGHPHAQYCFATNLAHGCGVDANLDHAVGYMKKAAEQGHAQAVQFFERNATTAAPVPGDDLSMCSFDAIRVEIKGTKKPEQKKK